jgi:hypothetical protein
LSRTKQSQAHKENIKQQDQAYPYIYKLKKKKSYSSTIMAKVTLNSPKTNKRVP